MEMEDGPIYSARTVCDYNINEKNVQQPDIPEPTFLKSLWYGFGRIEALYQIIHTANARAIKHGKTNEIVFRPKIKSDFSTDVHAQIVARNHVEQNLKRLGFKTRVNTDLDYSKTPSQTVHVPLDNLHNISRMRIFGPYMLFEKPFVLTQGALSYKKSKTK